MNRLPSNPLPAARLCALSVRPYPPPALPTKSPPQVVCLQEDATVPNTPPRSHADTTTCHSPQGGGGIPPRLKSNGPHTQPAPQQSASTSRSPHHYSASHAVPEAPPEDYRPACQRFPHRKQQEHRDDRPAAPQPQPEPPNQRQRTHTECPPDSQHRPFQRERAADS